MILPTTLIAPEVEVTNTSARLVAAVPVTVIASEKVTVPAPAASTRTPSVCNAPVAVTALAKVMDVVKESASTPAAVTVPEAKNAPVPFAIKLPNAVELEPTLPVIVTLPVDALIVRSFPAVAASTLPVIVMFPLPTGVEDEPLLRTTAVALFDNTSPVRRMFELSPAVTAAAREIVLPAVAALIATGPAAVLLPEVTVLLITTLSAVEVT